MTPKAPVPLLSLIDPKKNDWSKLGCAPLPTELLDYFGVGKNDSLNFHLAILCEFNKIDLKGAFFCLRENPYWQYFCGFEEFQQDFKRGGKNFERYYSKIRKHPEWARARLKVASLLFSKKARPVRKGKPEKLRDVLPPDHLLVLTKELFPAQVSEALCPPGVSHPTFLLLLLADKLMPTARPRDIRGQFNTNIYWRYFCGLEYFSDRTPKDIAALSRIRSRLKKNAGWKQARAMLKKAMHRAYAISRTNEPTVSLLFYRDLTPKIATLSLEILPDVSVVSGISGNRDWTLIAAAFKSAGWSTTFIGSDDLVMAQRNLHGPLMRFIPASNKEAAYQARSGRGEFADVIVEESSSGAPGKITYLSCGPRDPHARLEAALSPVRSLDEFLARTDVQDRYFEALSLSHPAHRFPKRSYDAILRQLKDILPELPLLKARLWEPRKKEKSFSIQADTPAFGRDFNRDEFFRYLNSYSGDLPEFALDRAAASSLIRQAVDRTDEKIRQFEIHSNAVVSKQERSKFYATLKSTPEVQWALKMLLHTCFKTSLSPALVDTSDSDYVLDTLRRLKLGPSAVLGDAGVLSFNQGFWLSLIRSALPGIPELLRLEQIFPQRQRSTRRGTTISRERFTRINYKFVPISRGLHGIWHGIPFNDCVAGQPDELDQLMPERWASCLLEDTICYDIIGSVISGYCQLVPFEHAGDRYLSVDTQWPPFFSLNTGGQLVFEHWLKKARGLIPADYKGLVVGNHVAGRPPFETEILQSLDCYKRGRVLDASGKIRFGDELATQIVQVSEKREYGQKYRSTYGSLMLSDATIGGDSSLRTVLNLD